MSEESPPNESELVECRKLIAQSIAATIRDPQAWRAANAQRRSPVNWSAALEDAASDIHQAALISALMAAVRWCFTVGVGGDASSDDLESPTADLIVPVRLILPHATIEREARIDTASPFGQYLLNVAVLAAEVAYQACRDRFCLTGQRELRASHLNGLQAAKHYANDLQVGFAIRQARAMGRPDADACEALGMPPATVDRIKKRIGLTTRRRKR